MVLAIDDDLSLLWEAYAYHRKAELYSFFLGRRIICAIFMAELRKQVFIIPPAFFFSLPVL
jgi:hypothetical protein